MAIDNLNFYNTGLPAGQQTDRYSSQPGCLRSKNLDIFSSSRSVKATAWSTPTQGDADVIKQDGKLLLKTDGKVYERTNNGDVLLVDPSINFPVYKVSYNGYSGTYNDAEWGTVKDLVVKYEGDEWRSYTVFTDQASYTYSKVPYIADKQFGDISSNLTYDSYSPYTDGYRFTKNSSSGSSSTIAINVSGGNFTKVPLRIYANQYNSSETDISLYSIKWYKNGYCYDPELDSMVPELREITTQPLPAGDIRNGITFQLDIAPSEHDRWIELEFRYTRHSGVSTYGWSGDLYIMMNKTDKGYRLSGYEDGDYNDYYSYLPVDSDRKLVNIGEYYWIKGTSFQPLYTWEGTWATIANGEKKVRYDLTAYAGWVSDVSMDVIGMTVWNEQVYMIGNMNGNGYIIPCDLSGGRGTPYIAYGCTFTGVANIDYLMYLVGDDRGISQLRAYNGQELVKVIGGNKESNTNDLIDIEEQYKFDGKIVKYRGNLILSTTDNRLFEYGQTYGGKGGVFIHEIPGTINELVAEGNDLKVKYSVTSGGTTTKYITTYQDDTPIKNYNTEWMAEYPIVIGNHLLEKEESDLYASYILPSANTSLEFWGCANHYTFWTFYTRGFQAGGFWVMPGKGSKWVIEGATGNYYLQVVDTDEESYITCVLVGDLPVLTGLENMKIKKYGGNNECDITDYHHFRKIGEITTTEYQEGEFRFHNLNNKLELPKSHSLQIMVKGKGTANYTPELFSLDLVANQRDRG